MRGEFHFSTDKTMLDIERIHDFLSNRSYWAKGRSLDAVRESIEHSLCFVALENGRDLAAFARVVTDRATFGYMMDFFVFEDYRGRGLGKQFLDYILEQESIRRISVLMLATKDAHSFYRRAGFRDMPAPGRYMCRLNPAVTAGARRRAG